MVTKRRLRVKGKERRREGGGGEKEKVREARREGGRKRGKVVFIMRGQNRQTPE